MLHREPVHLPAHVLRRYDPEFRAGAVGIVAEARRPVAEVARELGICEGTLGNWVRRDKARASGATLDGDERVELVRLRKRCAELETEA